MNKILNKQIILRKHPQGIPKLSDFEIKETVLPNITENQILIRNIYIGLEPRTRLMLNPTTKENEAMRPHGAMTGIGRVIPGTILGTVEQTRNSSFKEGDIVEGFLGWQNYVITDGKPHPTNNPEGLALCNTNLAEAIHHIGPLGAPGLTAILALKHEGKLKPNETMIVTSAAGMVGSLAGQLGLLQGAKVVGITSSNQKCQYLKDKLNFTACINYKEEDINNILKELCPEGIDYFFDNTGGEMANIIRGHLNKNGRVTRCGIISNYNKTGWNQSEQFAGQFSVHHHVNEYTEARKEMAQLLKNKSIEYEYKTFEGLENTPMAFIGLLNGNNIGKWIVKLS